MKGQERLDNCLKAGLVKPGTRFLWREHGTIFGPCREGTLLESVQDAEDANRAYVRLDHSGAWTEPHLVFVEYIFPEKATGTEATERTEATPAPAPGPQQRMYGSDHPGPVPVPINDKTKHPSRKPIK